MTTSLVTGGEGFIGSHVVRALIDIGHTVIVIDNESADNDKFVKYEGVTYHKMDICDPNTAPLYYGVDYVFHLAAESRLQLAINNPINAVQKNVLGTVSVLQYAREAGVKRVIYSSTSSAYGFNPIPNVESQPNDCLNPYSVSKVAGEELCSMYTKLYGLDTVILRYFNVYGPGAPTKGQYAPVIGIFLRQRRENKSLTIVGDGLQRRDFIHVDDVASANLCAAFTELPEYGTIYNVGSGKNVSINAVADSISEWHRHIPRRLGEVEHNLASIDKIKKDMAWEPQIDVLEWCSRQW